MKMAGLLVFLTLTSTRLGLKNTEGLLPDHQLGLEPERRNPCVWQEV